jgi:hypothetical protein
MRQRQEGTNAPTQHGTSAQTDGRPFSISHSCVWHFALKRTSESSAHLQIARMSGSFLGSNLALAAIAVVTPLVIGRGLGPGQFGRWIFFTAWAFTLTVAFDRRNAEAAPATADTRPEGGAQYPWMTSKDPSRFSARTSAEYCGANPLGHPRSCTIAPSRGWLQGRSW